MKPYFIHWYGLLITGIVDIIGAGIILARPTGRNSTIAAVGTALLAVFLIADIATYSMVGFTSASSFATYLFGFSKFKGSLPYIPGLYDVLFAFYGFTLPKSVCRFLSVNRMVIVIAKSMRSNIPTAYTILLTLVAIIQSLRNYNINTLLHKNIVVILNNINRKQHEK